MPPGQQAGSPQACPEPVCGLGFDISKSNSRRVFGWFTFVRLPSSHLMLSRSTFSTTFTTPAMVPAQLVVVWNHPLRGGSGGPTPIANAALLQVLLSTSDYPPHSWHRPGGRGYFNPRLP